jgi:hypothetical protein
MGWVSRTYARFRVNAMLDLSDKEAIPRLVGMGGRAMPFLLEILGNWRDARCPRVAHIIGKLAENRHINGKDAVGPLEEMLRRGDMVEAQSAAIALLRIGSAKSIGVLKDVYCNGNPLAKKCVYSATLMRPSGGGCILERIAQGHPDNEAREIARELIEEIGKRGN